MNKILVTGSAGQLAVEIVKLLKGAGYSVTGIDLVSGDTTDHIVNIRDMNAVMEVARGMDAIIHTAALHGKHTAQDYPRHEFIDTNVHGTNNLLRACVQHGIRKFLYTSTTSIYGTAMVNDQQAVWVDEDLVPQPRDIYDITKQACEWLCKDYMETDGIESTVLRVSRFLPEDDNTKANHRIYRGLDERDGAEAHRLVLEKTFDSFEIFNISNDTPLQKEDLVDLYHDPKKVICKYYPEAERVYAEKGWTFQERIDRVYSVAKAKRMLGYAPCWNFETFLTE